MIDQDIGALERLVRDYPRLVALTGAGLSEASGIPTYRDDDGIWQRAEPIQHQEFIDDSAMRRRYWARSMLGWRYVGESHPGAAHVALAQLETEGHVRLLVTQNVDRLHQRAGHQNVVDLHGRLDRVVCLSCGTSLSRADMQTTLEAMNPGFENETAQRRPDGDADVPDDLVSSFSFPACDYCAGVLMPDVVFFGGTVPRERVEAIHDAITTADALLVAGSSLMVYSGFRFCRMAKELGKPVLIVNRGRTRADDLATLKIARDCHEVLPNLALRLGTVAA